MKETIRKKSTQSGSGSSRLVYIPAKLLRDMGITAEEPYVWLIYDHDKKELTIKKSVANE